MEEQKWWLNSTTMRGVVLGLLTLVFAVIGKEVAPQDMTALVYNIVNVVTAIGLIWAAYGRIKSGGATLTLRRPTVMVDPIAKVNNRDLEG